MQAVAAATAIIYDWDLNALQLCLVRKSLESSTPISRRKKAHLLTCCVHRALNREGASNSAFMEQKPRIGIQRSLDLSRWRLAKKE